MAWQNGLMDSTRDKPLGLASEIGPVGRGRFTTTE